MPLVRALDTFHGPGFRTVVAGEVFEDTDQIVISAPSNFEPITPARRVEQATAAPGETRNAKRPASPTKQ